MTTLALGGLGTPELLIILAVVLLLFGGSRLAGLGKSSGRALREFKEETRQQGREGRGAATPPAVSTGTKGAGEPDPVVGDPVVTDPVVTDPVVSDPVVSDPVSRHDA